MPRNLDLRVMAVSPDQVELRETLPAILESLLKGGVTAFMMREKSLDDAAFLKLGSKLRALCDEFEATFILNERWELAEPMGANVVHLTWKSSPFEFGGSIRSRGLRVGKSIHSVDEAGCQKTMHGLDYVVAGPVYATPSKQGLVAPLGLTALNELCSVSDIPVVAIGGIKEWHIQNVVASGAQGIAGISSFFAAPDPAISAKEFRLAREAADVD